MRVKAALVIAKLEDGSDVYLYEGAPVPEGLKDGEVDRLKELGLLEDESKSDDGDKPSRRSSK